MYRSRFLAIALVFFVSCKQQQERIYPVETSITEFVYASVVVQPDSLYQAFAAVNGIIEKNLVEEGDIVNEGDLMVQIVRTNSELASKNAFLALQLARENYSGGATILSGLEEEIKAAKLQFLNDSINYRRQERLWEQQIGSRTNLENRKLAFQKSSAALEMLQSKYKQTQKELETLLKQAENTYKSSLVNTTDFSVPSKINGKVYVVHKKPGEIVNANQPLVTLGSAGRFVVEMLVDEEDVVRLRQGQSVYLNLDAYPGSVFNAIVHKIYPKKDERNQTFLVEALFENAPEVLYAGLSGEGNIVVAQKERALVIPRKFLIGDNQVRTDEGIKEVITGLQSIDTVEIIEGIDVKTELFLPE
jgi:HlyD family secretion protein